MRLLTLPVTVARESADIGLEVVKRVGGVAAGVAKGGYGVVAGGEETAVEEPRAPARSRAPKPSPRPRRAKRTAAGNGSRRSRSAPPPPPVVAPEPAAQAPQPAAQAPPAASQVPEHVDEEPELVAELAEEGAEDGAGAEVTVEEPWPGYDEMAAADIEDRLVTEDRAVIAAVRLYEASRKGRASVLEATSRGMGG